MSSPRKANSGWQKTKTTPTTKSDGSGRNTLLSWQIHKSKEAHTQGVGAHGAKARQRINFAITLRNASKTDMYRVKKGKGVISTDLRLMKQAGELAFSKDFAAFFRSFAFLFFTKCLTSLHYHDHLFFFLISRFCHFNVVCGSCVIICDCKTFPMMGKPGGIQRDGIGR